MAATIQGMIALMVALAAMPCTTLDGVEDSAAFAADDECAEAGESQSQCALNALQRRIAMNGTEFNEVSAASGHPGAKDFRLTHGIYADADDHAMACTVEFGPGARVARWGTDLITLSDDQAFSVMRALRINTTFNKKYYFVQKAGRQFALANWLDHDGHGRITLGSWFGISGPVLCVQGKAAVGLCGRISAKRVFDVQWSGSQRETTQRCYDFNKPYNPDASSHLPVDRETDYFILRRLQGGNFSLRLHGADGRLKGKLPDGEVPLASPEAVFYIIRGWYGTVITTAEHKDGDKATFNGLRSNSSPEVLSQYCDRS